MTQIILPGVEGIKEVESLDGSVVVTHGAGPVVDLSTAGVRQLELVTSPTLVSVPGDGTAAFLRWSHAHASTLLDYTNPTEPTMKAAGEYAFSIVAFAETTTLPQPGEMEAELLADYLGGVLQSHATGYCPLDLSAGGAEQLDGPAVPLSITRTLSTGDTIVMQIRQGSGTAINFGLFGTVQRLS